MRKIKILNDGFCVMAGITVSIGGEVAQAAPAQTVPQATPAQEVAQAAPARQVAIDKFRSLCGVWTGKAKGISPVGTYSF